MQSLTGILCQRLAGLCAAWRQGPQQLLGVLTSVSARRRNCSPDNHAEILHQVAMKMLEDLEEFLFLLRTIRSRGVRVAEQVHFPQIIVLIFLGNGTAACVVTRLQ